MSAVPLCARLSDALLGVIQRNREVLSAQDASILIQARLQLQLKELAAHTWQQVSETDFTCTVCGANSSAYDGAPCLNLSTTTGA
jgi:hypothetical protein